MRTLTLNPNIVPVGLSSLPAKIPASYHKDLVVTSSCVQFQALRRLQSGRIHLLFLIYVVASALAWASASEGAERSKPPSVVRLALGDLGLEKTETARVADIVVAELAQEKGIELVERLSIEKLLKEAELTLSGKVAPAQAVRVGKLLKADWFALGTKSRVGPGEGLFVKLVEARTGTIRDVKIFSLGRPLEPLRLGKELADYFRARLKIGEKSGTRQFVALGAFEDLSVGNRLATLPREIRNYLTRAYSGSAVVLLERDQVQWLLDEMSLSSLAERDGDDTQLRAAFWLVDGKFQFYQTEIDQVEIVLTVKRIGGRYQEQRIRARAGEALLTELKTVLDRLLADGSAGTRGQTEAEFQLERGRELSQRKIQWVKERPYSVHLIPGGGRDPIKERANLEEAVKSLQTVLLLDPENVEARILLLSCLGEFGLKRMDEARAYGREAVRVAKSPMWSDFARLQLANTVGFDRELNSLDELTQLEKDAVDPAVKASIAGVWGGVIDLAVKKGLLKPEKYAAFAEQRLIRELEWRHELEKQKPRSDSLSFNALLHAWNFDERATAEHVNRILPQLQEKFPLFKGALLAAAAGHQLDVSADPIKELVRAIESAERDPGAVADWRDFSELVVMPLFRWSFRHEQYELCVRVAKTRQVAEKAGRVSSQADDLEVMFYFALAKLGRFEEGLSVLEKLGNKTIEMHFNGPWGHFTEPVLPAKLADECRKKLGKPSQKLALDLGKPITSGHPFVLVAIDEAETWVASGNRISQLKSTTPVSIGQSIRLPNENSHPVVSIIASPTVIYLGTRGDGLICFDKKERKIKQFKEADGLLLNAIESLHRSAKTLWIGYGDSTSGALGWLDLATTKFSAYTPALPSDLRPSQKFGGQANLDSRSGPPRRKVNGIATTSPDVIWLAVWNKGIQRHNRREGTWNTFWARDQRQSLSCVVANERFVAAGCHKSSSWSGDDPRRGGLSLLELPKEEWEEFDTHNGLPNEEITALALSGNDLWIGGAGFLAHMDLVRRSIKETAYFKAESVNQIELTPSWIWASIGDELYMIKRPL